MAYLALYRKWRPRTFSEVIGQDAIMQALKNQIISGHIGHAYLFCGTRGCGKTSTAKILARAVNCEHPSGGDPCNECEMCRSGESDFNIVEIDAASNNGVDNIRELRDEVRYAPSRGRYKVYIIDEVHMLSTSAFNALLKTLEEPPEHVIFILATTEPHKILPTILSRCQRYDFRRISPADLTVQLTKIAQTEGIDADPAALSYIADAADGAARDALSILDQCAAFYMNERLSLEKVLDVLGAADFRYFDRMTRVLLSQDQRSLLSELHEMFATGRDTSRFLLDWIGYLRNVLLLKLLGADALPFIQVPDSELASLKELSAICTPDRVSYYVEELSQLELSLRSASEKRVLLEVGLLRLCRVESSSTPALLARIEILENALRSGSAPMVSSPQAAPTAGQGQADPVVSQESVATTASGSAQSFGAATASNGSQGFSSATASSAAASSFHSSSASSVPSAMDDSLWDQIRDAVSRRLNKPGLPSILRYLSFRDDPSEFALIAGGSGYKNMLASSGAVPVFQEELTRALGASKPIRLYDTNEYEQTHRLNGSSERTDMNALLSRLGPAVHMGQ